MYGKIYLMKSGKEAYKNALCKDNALDSNDKHIQGIVVELKDSRRKYSRYKFRWSY